VQPWYIATESFSPRSSDAWQTFVDWSGLIQLDEVVSLDPMLCPAVLAEIKPEYWPHIVNEDFMLQFFVDLGFLRAQVVDMQDVNLLCVYRNPSEQPGPPPSDVTFEFLGYDLVDVQNSASALTNCGGFPGVFDGRELSSKGLLTTLARAVQVQSQLRQQYPDETHADCHVWAIFRATGS
jgi:hypothetical protein